MGISNTTVNGSFFCGLSSFLDNLKTFCPYLITILISQHQLTAVDTRQICDEYGFLSFPNFYLPLHIILKVREEESH